MAAAATTTSPLRGNPARNSFDRPGISRSVTRTHTRPETATAWLPLHTPIFQAPPALSSRVASQTRTAVLTLPADPYLPYWSLTPKVERRPSSLTPFALTPTSVRETPVFKLAPHSSRPPLATQTAYGPPLASPLIRAKRSDPHTPHHDRTPHRSAHEPARAAARASHEAARASHEAARAAARASQEAARTPHNHNRTHHHENRAQESRGNGRIVDTRLAAEGRIVGEGRLALGVAETRLKDARLAEPRRGVAEARIKESRIGAGVGESRLGAGVGESRIGAGVGESRIKESRIGAGVGESRLGGVGESRLGGVGESRLGVTEARLGDGRIVEGRVVESRVVDSRIVEGRLVEGRLVEARASATRSLRDSLPPYSPTNMTTATSTPTATPVSSFTPSYSQMEDFFVIKRLEGRELRHSKILKDAASQIRAICFSPTRLRCYKLVRVLQSAIYGGVFEAEVYDHKTVRASPGPYAPIGKSAVKIMLRSVKIQSQDTLQEDIEAETNFQEQMKGHPNVLTYTELWEDRAKQACFVVMPFAEFQDLFEVLRKRKVPFSEAEARWLFRQLLSGVRYLHDRGVGFRDHSLENVLMFRSEVDDVSVIPKITDPGQAVQIRRDENGHVMDEYADKVFGKSFRPPEVCDPSTRRRYNPVKVDVFCMGWMLFFVVTKRQPFDRCQDGDVNWPLVRQRKFDELLKRKGSHKLSDELINLLSNMLHHNYKARYDPTECLNHPWFRLPECPIDDRTIWAASSKQNVHDLGPHPRRKLRRRLA